MHPVSEVWPSALKGRGARTLHIVGTLRHKASNCVAIYGPLLSLAMRAGSSSWIDVH